MIILAGAVKLKTAKTPKKLSVMERPTDGLMDGPTDGLTKRGVESRSSRLKNEEKEEKKGRRNKSAEKHILCGSGTYFHDILHQHCIFNENVSLIYLSNSEKIELCSCVKLNPFVFSC